MNIQEREQLTGFLQQLTEARLATKDPEADGLIREAVRQQPDALYLLVQRSMLLGQALESAQAQILRLQQAQVSSPPGGAFLDTNAWGNNLSPAAPRPPAPTPLQAAPANSGNWGSGLLGTVASTAAGVVAGSFLFQGIENLLGHHAGSAGLLAANDALPAQHIAPDSLAGNIPADAGSSSVDFDALGPGDSDPDWM